MPISFLQVVVSDSVAVSGRIQMGADESGKTISLMEYVNQSSGSEDQTLLQKDLYKELRLRGYHYKGIFQGIVSADLKGKYCMFSYKTSLDCIVLVC